jgi:hypothetical protein
MYANIAGSSEGNFVFSSTNWGKTWKVIRQNPRAKGVYHIWAIGKDLYLRIAREKITTIHNTNVRLPDFRSMKQYKNVVVAGGTNAIYSVKGSRILRTTKVKGTVLGLVLHRNGICAAATMSKPSLKTNMYFSKDGKKWKLFDTINHKIISLGSFAGRLFLGGCDDATVYVNTRYKQKGECITKPIPYGLEADAVLEWEAFIDNKQTFVKIQLRSTPNTPFVGPDGTEATYYETSGLPVANVHKGEKYIQARILLETLDPVRFTPIIRGIRIIHKSNR